MPKLVTNITSHPEEINISQKQLEDLIYAYNAQIPHIFNNKKHLIKNLCLEYDYSDDVKLIIDVI